MGDPDFSTPPAILDVAINAMREGLTHYSPSRGYLDLRLAIASKLSHNNNVSSSLISSMLTEQTSFLALEIRNLAKLALAVVINHLQ